MQTGNIIIRSDLPKDCPMTNTGEHQQEVGDDHCRMCGVRLPVTEDDWSCFTCRYFGSAEYDNGVPCCPNCGTHEGDGFGMAMNDPRYRDRPVID